MTACNRTLSLILPLFLLSALFSPVVSFCETGNTVQVVVHGVDERMYKNIMARLRINLYSSNSELNELEIRRLHRHAKADIASALAPYGYYLVETKAELKKIKTGWQAIYTVVPGVPVRISNIAVLVTGDGGRLPQFADPRSLMGLKQGDVLNQPFYEKKKKELLRTARSLGFLDAEYSRHRIVISRDRKAASIELTLETGRRYHFGETTSDQDVIDEDLLKLFIPWQENDYFDYGRLYELQRELYRTGFFSQVFVEAGTGKTADTGIPIEVRLEPLEYYNRYNFGVGYSTDTRFHLLFEWENRLFNKAGHRINTLLHAGEQESQCLVDYTIPVLDPRFYSAVLTSLWQNESWDDTVTSRLSAGAGLHYKTDTSHYGLSFEILYEDYSVGSTDEEILLLMPVFNGSWAFAKDVINTANGFRTTLFLSGATTELGSDVSFFKVQADGKIILTPLKGWRLTGRGTLGGILVSSIDKIPSSLRFYAGGSQSVRGYQYRSLGPVDESGASIGGTFLLTGSVEIEKSLNDFIRLFSFYDVGNAVDDLAVDLAHGIGAGIGFVLPFGHIRIELAYPLTDEGDAQYFYFTVGADL
ncbi:MAG: hypothetical protein CR981_02295 [Proteobacteria bacterium]|nr:MAG: hypothetical protein CR981_02295 [Pseudomonadota bacterium]PIE64172.1 MAG: hypothetical protein CSA26_09590 [Desulfobacterales bacterium]